MKTLLNILLCGVVWAMVSDARSAGFEAGTAGADLTPERPIRLAGYASRNKPSDGLRQPLQARALALRDPEGHLAVVLSADTIGFGPSVAEPIAERLRAEHGIPRERILLAASHSHNTPVMHGNLTEMYGLEGEELEGVREYTKHFQDVMVATANRALRDLEPVTLGYGEGEAGFAANRRAFRAGGVGFGVNPTGPVDQVVPVLAARRADGTVKALLFGYACHCTTPGASYSVCADWAGHARSDLETAFPEARAVFITGCGADANPEPRGSHEWARRHGLELAGAVTSVVRRGLKPVESGLTARLERVDLPLAQPLPGPDHYEPLLRQSNQAVVRYAQRQLNLIQTGQERMTRYPCPLQVWRFGADLVLVAMGGEVVVDYAHRLRREHPAETLWPAAYCNDVFAYVPSVRILVEGGYEAEFNLYYYGIPGRFDPKVENLLVGRAGVLIKETAGAGR